MYTLRTGCQWSALPVQHGSYKTVYHYFHKWALQGVFECVPGSTWRAGTSAYIRPTRVGGPATARGRWSSTRPSSRTCTDAMYSGANPTDRGHNATKVSTLTDARGTPLVLTSHRANRHDSKTLARTFGVAERTAGIREWMDNTIHAPAPQKRLRRRLELHGARVSLIDEFRASQMCSCCDSRLQDIFAPLHPKRGGVPESPRRGIVHAVKRCGECARVAADGARHARYVHRDVNAACNIARVYVALATRLARPAPFGRSAHGGDTAGA